MSVFEPLNPNKLFVKHISEDLPPKVAHLFTGDSKSSAAGRDMAAKFFAGGLAIGVDLVLTKIPAVMEENEVPDDCTKDFMQHAIEYVFDELKTLVTNPPSIPEKSEAGEGGEIPEPLLRGLMGLVEDLLGESVHESKPVCGADYDTKEEVVAAVAKSAVEGVMEITGAPYNIAEQDTLVRFKRGDIVMHGPSDLSDEVIAHLEENIAARTAS